jgi:hypothetical protein
VSEGQASKGSTPGGIENRRIKNPKGISSTHSIFAKSETLIGERTVVLWTSRSYEKEASWRELRSAESSIADRESGIREDSGLRQRKCQFPNREIPDRSKESVWRIFIGVRVFVRPDLVSAGLAITRGSISR